MEAPGREDHHLPASFNPHALVKKVYDDRAAMGRGE
jgi:2-oxoglutarate dehydrogenase E1 component